MERSTDRAAAAAVHAIGTPPARKHCWTRGACVSLSLLSPFAADATDDLQALYGNDVVSVATGYERKLFDAPATTTIITAADIRRLNADSLSEVLQSIAGVHVSSQDGRGTIPEVRGVTSRVLVLINNLPIVNGLINANLSLDNVLVDDIERVEVVRGPGSAIYGADAADGVVNIITKSSIATSGTELHMRGGSFDTYQGSLLHRAQVRDTHVGLFIGARRTDHTDAVIDADAQTIMDMRLGTSASLAPGPMNAHRDVLVARADIARGPWRLRASHASEADFGTAAGLAYALDPAGTYDSRYSTLEGTYQAQPAANWDITAYAFIQQLDQRARALRLYPAGAFGGLFPDGVRIDLDAREQRARGELAVRYLGFKSHLLRAGVGAFRNDFNTLYDARNFVVRSRLVIPTGTFAEGAGVNDPPFVRDATTDVVYGYVQDEWSLANDWRLTSGVRLDHYSEIGSHLSPRVGLVWTPRYNLTVKWLYGHAFKPPSVTETRSSGVLVALGNPNLEPESVDMLETSIQHRGERAQTTFSLFTYRQSNVIQTIASPLSPNGLAFVNRGTQNGWGLELEEKIQVAPTLFLTASYALQRRVGSDTDVDDLIRNSPQHAIKVNLSWDVTPQWLVYVNSQSILNRLRPASDPRPDQKDYTLVNLGVERSGIFGNTTLSVSLKNAFDVDARVASSSGLSIPNDIPLPGRALFAGLEVTF